MNEIDQLEETVEELAYMVLTSEAELQRLLVACSSVYLGLCNGTLYSEEARRARQLTKA